MSVEFWTILAPRRVNMGKQRLFPNMFLSRHFAFSGHATFPGMLMIPENGDARQFEAIDIFKTDGGGGVLWRGSFASLKAARARINELLISDPGEYFTYNQPTGHKVFFKPNGHNGKR